MINDMNNEEFLKKQNIDDFNPVIEFIDEPITLYDKIKQLKQNQCRYIAYTNFDYKIKEFVTHTYTWRITKKMDFEIMEVRRDFESYPTVYRNLYCDYFGTCRPIWKKQRTQYIDVEPDKNWKYLNEWYYNMGRSTNEININENIIASDTSLRYFDYKKNNYVTMLEYIRLYREHPIVETLMKLKLYRFIVNNKAIKYCEENKDFRKWINLHYEELQGMAFNIAKNAFKKNPDGNAGDYYNSLMYRIRCGEELAQHDREIYDYALRFSTQEKMHRYITDSNISNASYFDYLKACRWLQLNFNDTKVLYPHNFKEMHDNYTRQYSVWKLEQEKEKEKRIDNKMAETAQKFNFCEVIDKEFIIINAKSKLELIEEGSALGHCVGRMDYDKRQAEGKSQICFLRRAKNAKKSFVTIELRCNDLKVMQCYGKNDSKPSKDVIEFVDTWQKSLKEKQLQGGII